MDKKSTWQDHQFADAPKGHPSTWPAEVEALRRRVKELEHALTEISDIAKVSEGPAAQFYGMLADKALGPDTES